MEGSLPEKNEADQELGGDVTRGKQLEGMNISLEDESIHVRQHVLRCISTQQCTLQLLTFNTYCERLVILYFVSCLCKYVIHIAFQCINATAF